MSDFTEAIPKLIAFEGTTFTDDPTDHGGATKFGLTLAFMQGAVDKNYSEDELRDLTLANAEAIYKQHWWDKYGLGTINYQLLADKVFESITNMGPNPGFRILQKAVNDLGTPIHIDGIIGPSTIAAINKLDGAKLLAAVKANLVTFYNHIVEKDPSQAKYLKGWLNRANG